MLEMLEWNHVPAKVSDLILDYYNNFKLKAPAGTTTSEWHRPEVGIIIGSTISVILFALAMNMLQRPQVQIQDLPSTNPDGS